MNYQRTFLKVLKSNFIICISIIILSIILYSSKNAYSANALDSLKLKLKIAKSTEKPDILKLFLSREDSLSQTLEFIQLALKNSENEEDKIYFQLQKALYYARNFHYLKAYSLLDSCITASSELNLDSLTATAYFYKADIYSLESNYKDAVINYYEAIKYYENKKDTENIVVNYNRIGMAYITFNDTVNYKKAIGIFTKAYNIIKKNPQMVRKHMDLINNVGVAYDGIGENERALDYYIKYYEYAQKFNDISSILVATLNIGDSYRILQNYSKAKEFTNKCLSLAEKNSDLQYYYFATANMAEINNELGDYREALTLLEKIKKGLLAYNDDPLTQFYLKLLAKVYFNIGKYKESAETYKYYINFNDSLFSIETKMKISEFEAKYENEKKEQTILLLEKNDEINQARIKRQTLMRNSFIVGFLLMLLLAFTIFRAYRTKRKDNNLLHIKNNEIFQQKEEIAAQRDEITAQRDMVILQKDFIEVQKKEITDSINYAKRIQQALLPDLNVITRAEPEVIPNNAEEIALLPLVMTVDYFILFRPKDIVSGDFYWATKINDFTLIAVADCTGHGVPGGFMSMLGISFLNEIVRRKEITKANQVLNELRKSVIDALKESGHENENSSLISGVKDGMDISLIAISQCANVPISQLDDSNKTNCQISKSNNQLIYHAQWAGANNPLWIIRNNPKSLQGFETLEGVKPELEELKGDKMPIAIYDRMDDFTNHELQLFSGDTIYLLSDGYQDQFGGPSKNGGKKFKATHLKKLLLDNSHLSLEQQKQLLEEQLITWQNNYSEKFDQTDDITILGVKFN